MNGKIRLFIIFLCVCLCSIVLCLALASSPSFAAELETSSEPLDTSEPVPVITEPYIVSEEVVRNVSPVTPSDANGFKAVLLGLFGDYETVVTEHRYTSSNGYTSIQVTTEPDYAWMISAAIFIVVLYCLFRLLGGVLCGRK